MKITKFGHCCLLIEESGVRILTDPGIYTETQNTQKDIDLVIITHEHPDHFHIDSLKLILQNNPQALVVTSSAVGKLLDEQKITYKVVEESENFEFKGVLIEGFGKLHAQIHSSIPAASNTGYFIANKLFYPGDALTDPSRQIETLALPVAGPWIKLSEAVDYALKLKPKMAFPVHDALLKNTGTTDYIPSQILPKQGIDFEVLEIGKPYNL